MRAVRKLEKRRDRKAFVGEKGATLAQGKSERRMYGRGVRQVAFRGRSGAGTKMLKIMGQKKSLSRNGFDDV